MYPTRKNDIGDVQVLSGIAWRPDQDQQVKLSGEAFDQPGSNCECDAQVVTVVSAVPLNEVVSDSSTLDVLKEGCLDDAKLLSRSMSVEAQEQAPFDEETSKLLRGEDKKQQNPSSEEPQDADEHSGTKIFHGDLRKTAAPDENDRHLDKIGAPAIGDLKQGNEGTEWRLLLDTDDDTISQKACYYFVKLRSGHPDDDCHYLPPYDLRQLTELYEQLALYRIRGYQLSMDQQLAELNYEDLKKHYSSAVLFDEQYFEYYEESLEWYFDPELCKHPGYDNYQRLVLKLHSGDYLDWDYYHSTLNTYEEDLAYVQYCEALANESKWIEEYLRPSMYPWTRIQSVAHLQALQIATGFPNVSRGLVLFAFQEHLWRISTDHTYYKDMDDLYFEIWTRVAKLKKDFREALLEIHRENMFPLRMVDIKHELEEKKRRLFHMKDDYDAYVACIDEMVSDDKARQDIREALQKIIPKPMIYLDYIQKKVDIAKEIRLIGKEDSNTPILIS